VLVKRAEYVKDYVVKFTFTDGSTRETDLKPFLQGSVFEPWKDRAAFRTFKVRYGSIVWPNGAGIAPETLYLDLGPVDLVPYTPESAPPRRRTRRPPLKEPEWVVKRATYVRDYVVEFTFADGSKREMDLSPFLRGPIYEPLKDLDAFRRFKVRYGTIVWPNGADIAPETLYYDLGPIPSEPSAKA